ncbi:hypothetical protein TMP248_140048 [Tenacibaculum maritimum]|uniref:hypothetical protein n=1 Tax=Tenacibaculum maritimum TaxID=107401 RepID=UPI0012E44B62|nr:hypothetical protein [Tenacibaculum maritimum]CAA0173236.1 hypothetical protein TMP248_140048 [Tenacibaculum maritimum]
MPTKIEITDKHLKLKSLENMLEVALIDANQIQSENSTREMSMIIRSIEDAQDKLWRLKLQNDASK